MFKILNAYERINVHANRPPKKSDGLKKTGLELIPSNYRPVSNLSFCRSCLKKQLSTRLTLIAINKDYCLDINLHIAQDTAVKRP